MRNLQLIDLNYNETCPQFEETQSISIDYDTGYVYAVNKTSVVTYDPRCSEFIQEISLSDAGYLPSAGSETVVGLQHLPDQMSACIATITGDVIIWNTASNELECVGTVDSGITSMAWSPDQEILILGTGKGTLIAMTREFDPITEIPMMPEEFGEAEFITVGWGKKETQFHGSAGKEAAKKKQVDAKPAFPWDDRKVRISWRGDGQFFAVSTINPHNGSREMRVWTRDLVLHSTSEKVDGLEQALGWKPSGSLIASSQRRPNKHDIVFIEKNGLRHGEFTLPFGVNDVKVRDVLWNNDSTVLLVWCEDKVDEGESVTPKSYLQLWTVNNYHWYLKQSLQFGADRKDGVVAVIWDPEHAYRLHVVCCGGTYLQYTFCWTTSHSHGQTADDYANVGVIDGVKVLMTPFRNMVVPPPMCAYHLEMPVPASKLAFGPMSQANAFAALLCDGRIAIYRFNTEDDAKPDDTVKPSAGKNFKQMCATPTLQGIYSFESILGANVPLGLYHLTWCTENKLLVCSHHDGNSVISWLEISNNSCSQTGFNTVPGSVLAVAADRETCRVVLQLTDRTLLVADEDDHFIPFCDSSGREISFPLSCTQMALCHFGGEEVVLGLTDRFRFYINDIELANNCTSFALHEEFLILTTHSHTCHCLKRNTPLKSLTGLSEGKAHPFDETIRRVERGSRIVHVVAEDTKLILQMPRGNLETIHPRALVLSAVRKRLDKLEFGEAFILMKKHRINMNLIYDHNPDIFIKNVDTFVCQVESVNHINLFLTDLQEEDVTKTMYTAAYTETQDPEITSESKKKNKVDLVCDVVRNAVEKIDSDKYLLSILTAYVKKTNPELDTALNRIKSLKESSGNDNRSQHVAEEALKFLLFLVDVNELYDHALGTYDFDLVLMVAEKSQKDPKEYLPFLNHLRNLEENYQRYSIDKHLKRHKSALGHIAKCGDGKFSECFALVKDQKLYSEALKLFPRGESHYKEIAVSYGEFLSEKSLWEEAGLVYYKAEEWEKSLSSFTQACNWRQALITANKLNYSPDKMADLATSMATKLADDRRHVEAACLLEQYAGDIEEAIMILIRGSCWEESLRLMYKHKRTDFIESDLITALVEAYNNHLSGIDALLSDFERHRMRLSVVRQEKEKARLELLEGGGDHNLADADLFSDTSSATGESIQSSRYSSASGRTSSSRRSRSSKRKAERKLWSLKEGSRHEDLALIEALYRVCQRAEGLKEDIQPLLRMLYLFDEEDKASELQVKLDEFLALITRHTAEIWNPDEATSSADQPTLGPDATTNSIIAAMQQGRSQKPEIQLEPHLRIPPPMGKDRKWQLHSVSPAKR